MRSLWTRVWNWLTRRNQDEDTVEGYRVHGLK